MSQGHIQNNILQQILHTHTSWQPYLTRFFNDDQGQKLLHFLAQRQHTKIYPYSFFRALQNLALQNVRVVIMGQDPYHSTCTQNGVEKPYADGAAFSAPTDLTMPPSLRNILIEAIGSVPHKTSSTSWLDNWTTQGVLLLNTALSVEHGSAASHSGRATGYAWESLTTTLLKAVLQHATPCVWLLWGKSAAAIAQNIFATTEYAEDKLLTLFANHPSPLSARRGATPFIGCGHFVTTNQFLTAHHCQPINWHAL